MLRIFFRIRDVISFLQASEVHEIFHVYDISSRLLSMFSLNYVTFILSINAAKHHPVQQVILIVHDVKPFSVPGSSVSNT